MKILPTEESQARYEVWHTSLPVDVEGDAPWHRLIRKHLNPSRDLRGKRILEIGCGRGGFAISLAQQPLLDRPYEIVASDFSPAALKKGQQFALSKGVENITWELGDIQNIAHPASSFDTVISCETVEHLPEPQRAVCELARVLKPGGRLLLTTPNYLGTLGIYRGYLWLCGRPFREEGQPINRFTVLPRTISWIMRSGMRIEQIDAVGHYLPFPGRPPIEMPRLNKPRCLMKWLGLHSLVLARKPGA